MPKIGFLIFTLLISIVLTACNKDEEREESVEKPVIYLYPEEKTEVSVQLEYKGDLIFTYPEYRGGWEVTAEPNGTIVNKSDGKEYSYLFWEGKDETDWKMNTGFVIKGEDTADFLREKLKYLGLTPKEYNEFIVYWAPRMENNPYNLIHFAGKEYDALAPLTIEPKPDSILRIFMVYKPLEESIKIEEQSLHKFIRKGFTVIEWGGRELDA